MTPPSLPDTATTQPTLSPQFDVEKFNRDGYLVLPDFLPPETVSLLRQRVTQLLDDFSLEGHPMTKFSTGEKEAHVGDHVGLFSVLALMCSTS
jgi:phytanoyl-CoA hydroxylase